MTEAAFNPAHLTQDLITLGVELLVLLFGVLAVYAVLRRIIDWVAARPSLERFEAIARTLRGKLKVVLLILGLLAAAGILVADILVMLRGELLHVYTLELARSIPPAFWAGLGVAAAKVVGLLVGVAWLLRRLAPLLQGGGARAKAYEGISTNDESIERLFASAETSIRRVVWLLVLAVAAHLLGLPEVIAQNVRLAAEVVAIIAAGLLLWRGVDVVIDSLEALSEKYADGDGLLRFYGKFSHLVGLFRRAVEYAIYLGVATLVLLHISLAAVAEWGPRFMRIIGALFLSRVVVEGFSVLLDEVVLIRPRLTEDQRNRRLTILPLLKSIAKYGVYFAVGVFVLQELGINPTPILAGAGIAAMAVGLGAQNLINDMVSGFFILFENYFIVGDYVVAGGAKGVVEQIDLRTTRIRDDSGRLHIVRNGLVDTVVNYSKEFTFAVVDVGVAYESDLGRVFGVLREVGERLDAELEDVMEPTTVRGVESFGESDVGILTTTRVRPGRHQFVERELRRRIKEAFEEAGVEIPYPRRVILTNGDGDAAGPALPAATD